MTSSANQVLQAFDSLSEADRHKVSVEMLRRVLEDISAEISDDALVLTAEQIFLELDLTEEPDAGA